jgi:hypothetical protein
MRRVFRDFDRLIPELPVDLTTVRMSLTQQFPQTGFA